MTGIKWLDEAKDLVELRPPDDGCECGDCRMTRVGRKLIAAVRLAEGSYRMDNRTNPDTALDRLIESICRLLEKASKVDGFGEYAYGMARELEQWQEKKNQALARLRSGEVEGK